MIDFLTLVIIGVALLQPTSERMMAALVFASMTFIHNTFMHNLDGLAYYGSDALFYLIVISITASLKNIPKLTIRLHQICLAAIALDFVGWIMWMAYLPPDGYNVAFMLLYAWTIIVLIRKDKEDAGNHAMGAWHNFLHPDHYSSRTINHRH